MVEVADLDAPGLGEALGLAFQGRRVKWLDAAQLDGEVAQDRRHAFLLHALLDRGPLVFRCAEKERPVEQDVRKDLEPVAAYLHNAADLGPRRRVYRLAQ